MSEAQKAEVETLAAVLNAEQVADYFGIGRRTFYTMMQRDEEIAARYKKGKAKAIGAIAHGLINKPRSGDTTAMIFFLKTQAGWRETSTIEHMLPEDPKAVVGPSRQRLAKIINAIVQCNTAFAEFAAVPPILGPADPPDQTGDDSLGPTARPDACQSAQ